MARPPKDTGNISDTPQVDYFDKYLVAVNREGRLAQDGSMVGRTQSVQIRECIRPKMPCAPVTVNSLNSMVEHRNPTDQGKPVIEWYFPHGKVHDGETYLASDIFHEVEETDEFGDTKTIKTNKITGLKIHLDKQIDGFDGKKPIFKKKAKPATEEVTE